VTPREKVAPLFAVKLVQRGGPDRSQGRQCELDGISIEGVNDLLELSAAGAV
jgi:hypothetical protein